MLLSSSNRKYPSFPLLSYFSVIVCLRCLLHHILSPLAYTDVLASSSYSFVWTVHHLISPLCKHIWRHWTYKMPARYILSSVWVRLSIFSVIHNTICGPVCFQFTHFSCDDWDNIYMLCLIIIINSEVWTITHCLGSGQETMLSTVCLNIFLCMYTKASNTIPKPTQWDTTLLQSQTGLMLLITGPW